MPPLSCRGSLVPGRIKLVFGALLLVIANGCDGRPTRVPVSGQVLIDGRPLTRGQIMFVSSAGRASQGRLGKDGHFRLSCYSENDGALLGTHQVAITAADAVSTTETRWYAPKKLADYRTSGLTQEITGPTDDLVINVSWEGGHEFVEVEAASADEGMPGNRRAKKKPAE